MSGFKKTSSSALSVVMKITLIVGIVVALGLALYYWLPPFIRWVLKLIV